MRIVFTADTHLGFDHPLRPRAGYRHRGEDFFANYERVLRHVLDTRPDVFVHGGDFFDSKRVAPAIVDHAFLGLREVADAGIPVVIAPGNHDRSRLPASLWLAHPNIHHFERPKTIVLERPSGRVAIAGFPFAWGDVQSDFPGILASTGMAACVDALRLLLCHHAFDGATVGPHNFVFRRGRDVIQRADIPHLITAVLSGHIHRAQVLEKGPHPAVIYPGSIERTSFAERDEPKGFCDLTFAREGGTWRLQENCFLPLPARQMAEVLVPELTDPSEVERFLVAAAATLPRDAIVRVSVEPVASPEVAQWLTANMLHRCFPQTMTVHHAWRAVPEVEAPQSQRKTVLAPGPVPTA